MSKKRRKKKKTHIKDTVKKGQHLQNIDIYNGYPMIKILFPWLADFNDMVDRLFVDYDKLVKNNDVFIDRDKGIKVTINTNRQTYTLSINGELIFDEPLLFQGDWELLSQQLSKCSGLFLDIEFITKVAQNAKQHIIKVADVIVDGVAVVDELEQDYIGFLKLPNKEWYRNGQITPGALGVGTMLLNNQVEPVIHLSWYNSNITNSMRKKIENMLEISDKFTKNLSIILDEKDENRILGKIEIMGKLKDEESFEATMPINIGVNYQNFKKEFHDKGYVYYVICGDDEMDEANFSEDFIVCKSTNIMFIDESNRDGLISWTDPLNIELGGIEAQKKILINSANMEVGIYKHFDVNKIQSDDIRKIVNELLAFRIGKELGVNVAAATYHFEQSTIGLISKLVTPPVRMYKDISINDIEDKESIIDMVAFDIFLHNTDRHHENICVTPVGNKYKAILIDHTRCFGGDKLYDLKRLKAEYVNTSFHFTGLSDIANYIVDISQFDRIIELITNLNIDKIVHDVFINESLYTIVKSCDVYEVEYFEAQFIELLNERKHRIKNIITKSLGL